ncbi:Serine-threonine protein kinase [Entamoeba marina]
MLCVIVFWFILSLYDCFGFICNGSGCVNCIYDNICESCKEGYETSLSCDLCQQINPFIPLSESNPLYLKFNDVCTKIPLENVSNYWNPINAIELPYESSHTFEMSKNIIPTLVPCETLNYNNRYHYVQWYHVTIPEMDNNFLNIYAETNNCDNAVFVSVVDSLFNEDNPLNNPNCYAFSSINPPEINGSIISKLNESNKEFYVGVYMSNPLQCNITVSILNNTSASSIFNIRTFNISTFQENIQYVIDLEMINQGYYDYSICSLAPVRQKIFMFNLIGNVKENYTFLMNVTNGEMGGLERLDCDSYLNDCICIDLFTKPKERWNERSFYGGVVFGAKEIEATYKLYTSDNTMSTKVIGQLICPNDCSSDIGGGLCSYNLASCVCSNSSFGGDDCHLLCYANGQFTIDDDGKCEYGVSNCDVNCNCINNTTLENHMCITQECLNFIPAGDSTLCQRGKEHCLPTCECDDGYKVASYGRCVSVLCGNGIIDENEECDVLNDSNCNEFCQCESGFKADEASSNICVAKESYLYIYLSFLIIGAMFIVILIVSLSICLFRLKKHNALIHSDGVDTSNTYFLDKSICPIYSKFIKYELTPYKLYFDNKTRNFTFQSQIWKRNQCFLFFHSIDNEKYTTYSSPSELIILPHKKQNLLINFIPHCTTNTDGIELYFSIYCSEKKALNELVDLIRNQTELVGDDFVSYEQFIKDNKCEYNWLEIKKNTENSMFIDVDDVIINQKTIMQTSTLDNIKNLRCPFIVPTIGIVIQDYSLMLVSEYFPLNSLSNYIHHSDIQLPYLLKLKILKDVTRGLLFLHDLKILHLNLKPSNVILNTLFIGATCVAKITHFMISDVFERMEEREFGITGGNPLYDAPEKYNEMFSEASDVYSFGILAWEVFYGKEPFEDYKTLYDIKCGVLKGLRPNFDDNIPTELKKLIENCWQSDPNNRISMIDIVQCLDNIICLSGEYDTIDDNVNYSLISDVYNAKWLELEQLKAENVLSEVDRKELFSESSKSYLM